MPDHAALIPGPVAGAGRQQHVPGAALWVREYPRVAPRLVRPAHVGELLVPAGVAFQYGRGWVPAPVMQVSGGGEAYALFEPALLRAAAGIEHEPHAVRTADHRAGPGRHVVKPGAGGRGDRIGDDG